MPAARPGLAAGVTVGISHGPTVTQAAEAQPEPESHAAAASPAPGSAALEVSVQLQSLSMSDVRARAGPGRNRGPFFLEPQTRVGEADCPFRCDTSTRDTIHRRGVSNITPSSIKHESVGNL